MRVDPTGALDGWYKDENGTTTYDANINSQADLNSAGIKGSYVGQTFSGTMSNGLGVSGDAQGNLSMSLPEVSISAYKNSTSLIDNIVAWTRWVPVLGSCFSSGQKLDRGNYLGAAADFSYALLELFSFTIASKYTIPARVASNQAVKGGANLTKSQLKSISSLEGQIAKHQSKLAKYIKDPMKFDNKGFLKNAPNDAIRQKIIQSRINNLNQEINTFKSNIDKILNGQ